MGIGFEIHSLNYSLDIGRHGRVTLHAAGGVMVVHVRLRRHHASKNTSGASLTTMHSIDPCTTGDVTLITSVPLRTYTRAHNCLSPLSGDVLIHTS
jgi:hypothetical protein